MISNNNDLKEFELKKIIHFIGTTSDFLEDKRIHKIINMYVKYLFENQFVHLTKYLFESFSEVVTAKTYEIAILELENVINKYLDDGQQKDTSDFYDLFHFLLKNRKNDNLLEWKIDRLENCVQKVNPIFVESALLIFSNIPPYNLSLKIDKRIVRIILLNKENAFLNFINIKMSALLILHKRGLLDPDITRIINENYKPRLMQINDCQNAIFRNGRPIFKSKVIDYYLDKHTFT